MIAPAARSRSAESARHRARASREGMDGTSLRVYGSNSKFCPLSVLYEDNQRIHVHVKERNMDQTIVVAIIRTQGFSCRVG